jgi:aminoglycoside phosphotransferase (APT) family kinase protein
VTAPPQDDDAPPPEVRRAAEAFAAGRPLGALRPMPGHAGFSYGVEVAGAGYVLRVPPPGTRHEGPADVVRQAKLLQALAAAGVPVPAVRGLEEGAAPWFAVDLLPGTTLRPTDDGPQRFDAATLAPLGLATVDALAAIHRVPLPDWLGPARAPEETVRRWDRFAQRSADPVLLEAAPAVRQALLDRAPRAPRTGLVHGDFQWGNVLAGPLDAPRLLAVIDWELAHHGSVLDDVGWLTVFSDARFWAGDAMPVPAGIPAPDAIAARYGTTAAEVAWHVALAAYAFAVVIGLNLMLHRRGKRHDPLWEELAPSAPVLLRRAAEHLGDPVVLG